MDASEEIGPTAFRGPDFIIAGGMKCGTTSMHSILSCHPGIFIPEREIGFFDVDDLIQHPDFFFFDGRKWFYPELSGKSTEYWEWYSRFFAGAKKGQLLGEDSPSYLASDIAPRRIANISKEVKIIAMLRDPAERAFSHYWHRVRSGRSTLSFEDTLLFEPASLLARGLYERQVRQYLNVMPRRRIHFVVFEDFVRDPKQASRNVMEFLGLDWALCDFSRAKFHANAGVWPRYAKPQLWRNRLLRDDTKLAYRDHLVDVPASSGNKLWWIGLADTIHSRVNPFAHTGRRKMRRETRIMLDDYFSEQNAGLSTLLEINLDRTWYHSRHTA